MRKYFFLLAGIFLINVKPSHSQSVERWVYIGEQNNVFAYIDKETIEYRSYDKSYKVYWKVTQEENDPQYSVNLAIFYCGEREYCLIETHFYDKDGNYLNSIESGNFYRVFPESNSESIYNYLCK